jgi:hypothetical protein
MHKVTPQRLQLKMTTGSKKEKANTGCFNHDYIKCGNDE